MAKNLERSVLLDFYGSMLSEKQRRLFTSYYDDDLSLAEIADLEGMTRQGVRDGVKRAEAQLCETEERLGLARRFYQMQEGLQEIRHCAEQLSEACKETNSQQVLERLLFIVAELEQDETEQ